MDLNLYKLSHHYLNISDHMHINNLIIDSKDYKETNKADFYY